LAIEKPALNLDLMYTLCIGVGSITAIEYVTGVSYNLAARR